uniref:Uncharacterized protein n=1 Tax=Chromera velia CCMP2878 TaxID=1169474 RepID=A0A0G4FYI0_9ALVE|eukprot:Cvel_19324.t1-p1 / transcript=Cvel_19324.t1 / gene=Cvel_19324 / organism=Chromera_velia_CCMP2878 / gene_product=hypothetical protein / transcript_product=hypothetical protein / location=Cvel_scaffold1657:28440-33850(+) / protein_length=939 / sequence_SO=supercontig / SO=protein_coding / is_pseudo=false
MDSDSMEEPQPKKPGTVPEVPLTLVSRAQGLSPTDSSFLDQSTRTASAEVAAETAEENFEETEGVLDGHEAAVAQAAAESEGLLFTQQAAGVCPDGCAPHTDPKKAVDEDECRESAGDAPAPATSHHDETEEHEHPKCQDSENEASPPLPQRSPIDRPFSNSLQESPTPRSSLPYERPFPFATPRRRGEGGEGRRTDSDAEGGGTPVSRSFPYPAFVSPRGGMRGGGPLGSPGVGGGAPSEFSASVVSRPFGGKGPPKDHVRVYDLRSEVTGWTHAPAVRRPQFVPRSALEGGVGGVGLLGLRNPYRNRGPLFGGGGGGGGAASTYRSFSVADTFDDPLHGFGVGRESGGPLVGPRQTAEFYIGSDTNGERETGRGEGDAPSGWGELEAAVGEGLERAREDDRMRTTQRDGEENVGGRGGTCSERGPERAAVADPAPSPAVVVMHGGGGRSVASAPVVGVSNPNVLLQSPRFGLLGDAAERGGLRRRGLMPSRGVEGRTGFGPEGEAGDAEGGFLQNFENDFEVALVEVDETHGDLSSERERRARERLQEDSRRALEASRTAHEELAVRERENMQLRRDNRGLQERLLKVNREFLQEAVQVNQSEPSHDMIPLYITTAPPSPRDAGKTTRRDSLIGNSLDCLPGRLQSIAERRLGGGGGVAPPHIDGGLPRERLRQQADLIRGGFHPHGWCPKDFGREGQADGLSLRSGGADEDGHNDVPTPRGGPSELAEGGADDRDARHLQGTSQPSLTPVVPLRQPLPFITHHTPRQTPMQSPGRAAGGGGTPPESSSAVPGATPAFPDVQTGRHRPDKFQNLDGGDAIVEQVGGVLKDQDKSAPTPSRIQTKAANIAMISNPSGAAPSRPYRSFPNDGGPSNRGNGGTGGEERDRMRGVEKDDGVRHGDSAGGSRRSAGSQSTIPSLWQAFCPLGGSVPFFFVKR